MRGTHYLGRIVRSQLRRGHRDLVRFPWPGSLAEHLSLLFAFYGVNVVFDVGANSGEYAEMLRTLGYTGLIVSFEPASAAYSRLVHRSRKDPSWLAFQCALGDSNGSQQLTIFKHDVLSSLRPPVTRDEMRLESGWDLMPSFEEVRREDVEVRRLDSLVPELLEDLPAEPRAFLKLDTQGFDLPAFAGSTGCRQMLVGIQSELSYQALYEGMPSADEAVAEFRRAGFVESGFFPVHVDEAFRAVELDGVFVHS